MPKRKTPQKKVKTPKYLHLAQQLVFICVALAIVLSAAQFTLHGIRYKRLVNESTYQVVALTNGQTFFGQLERYGMNTYVLTDVYYIQTEQAPIQEAATEDGPAAESTQDQVKVVPLVDDFHQPYNHIVLNREHIVFWQNLNPSSPVIEAISELHGS